MHDFNAVINHCGNISKRFEIARGCRQGDPIASYLFILCIEILAHKIRSSENIEGISLGNTKHLIEIYADDLSVYLEPTDDNLRNVVEVLENFFKLSGLKISVSKTKAVWFGSKCGSEDKLCQDLNLNWVATFTLLGMKFDSALANMEDNFDEKLVKIQNMLSNWSFRYLTPFGKITVIKSLALSKLSHVALVVPNPSKDKIKRIETVLYRFLWGGGSEKIRREDSKLPPRYGGLGMPDINNFWTAFKFSWLRRLLQSQAFWPDLLLQQISKIISVNDLTASDLLQLGVGKINEISKKLKNIFWRQVLASTPLIAEGSIFHNPEKFINTSFWDNPLIKRNNMVKFNDFPEISDKIKTVADFFYHGTNEIMQYNHFCERYECNISEVKYIDIRHTIAVALQKLKLPLARLNIAQYPQKPILIDILLSTPKGCSFYSKLLSKKSILCNKIVQREAKWHAELGTTFSIDFWSRARHFCTKIDFDNQLRWLQHQIVRNSLQTNYIVSHFRPNVSKICTFCQHPDSLELVSHIFWFCSIAGDFIKNVFEYISNLGLPFMPSRTEFLFGYQQARPFTPINFISLVLKKYIWKVKFKNATLTMDSFKSLLKVYLCDLKFMFEVKNMPDQFNEWITVFDALQ